MSTPRRRAGAPEGGLVGMLATALLLVLLAAAALYRSAPPSPVSATAPATTFSAARAMEHVRAIAKAPHPMGSAEHARVREYLMARLGALGLEPRLQESVGVYGRTAGHITNVIARMPGRAPRGPAILLDAHYDGVQAGPAAGDDGSGVATLLETAAVLRAGAPPANDIIFLFSDGEEDGLLGASAFNAEHPWKSDVGFVLDFEARGAGGASLMFETGEGNLDAVRAMRRATTHPVASSLFYSFYKLLPNDTDFSVFKRHAFQGLNFSNVGDFDRYHSPLDRPDQLSTATLQHHGDNAVQMARYLGSLDSASMPGRVKHDAVFFVVPVFGMIVYDEQLSIALLVVAGVLLVAGIVRRARDGDLSIGGVVLGIIALPVMLGVAGGLGALLWIGVAKLHAAVGGSPITSRAYLSALVFLGVVAAAVVYRLARRFTSAASVFTGALIWWFVAAAACVIYLRAGSYVLVLPLIAGALALAADAPPGARGAVLRVIVVTLLAVPAVWLVTPFFPLLTDGLTLSVPIAAAIAALTAFMLAGIGPQLERLVAGPWWRTATVAFVAALGCAAFGAATIRYTPLHPRYDSLHYVLDADAGSARWVANARIDEWQRRVLGPEAKLEPPPISALFGSTPTWQAPAPALPLPAPELTVLHDSIVGTSRVVEVRVRSPRDARMIWLDAPGSTIEAATVDGRPTDATLWKAGGSTSSLRLINPTAAGFVVSLTIRSSGPLTLRVTDASSGYPPATPSGPVPPRPANYAPRHAGDLTLVTKSVGI